MSVNSLSSTGLNLLSTLVLLPFFVLSTIIIGLILFFLDIKSPVFFTQMRIGYLGNPFYIYKFRTLKQGNSPNKFTRFLRLSGLDEVPQILNILKGEMRLFGPRPKLDAEIPEEYLISYKRIVLKRRPGLLSLYMSEKGPGQSMLQKQDMASLLIYERYEQMKWSPKLTGIIFFRCVQKIFCSCIDYFSMNHFMIVKE
jgi:lipopolysaccharide/colanic/teichoic acid biosynthesis glycosyltransferase